MNEEIQKTIEQIKNFETISEIEKAQIVEILSKGTPFEEEFLEYLQEVFDAEITHHEAILEKESDEIDQKKRALDEEKKRKKPELQNLYNQFMQICQSELDKFETEIKQIEKDNDEKIESIIHEQGENAEIDAIRNSLKK